jgi:hypothetical protein
MAMTAEEFRSLALSLPETMESEHMGHPDFRVGGKVFATLGWPNADWAMVNLTPDVQAVFVRSEPRVFQPVKGGWGRRGSTNVALTEATVPSVRQALVAAWRKRAPKRLAQKLDDE